MITRISYGLTGTTFRFTYTWDNSEGFAPYKYHRATVATDTGQGPATVVAEELDCFPICDVDIRFVLSAE